VKTGRTITVLLALCCVAMMGCDSGGDAGDLAGALEDRLTDALDFDGGETEKGAPPEESSNADAPAITTLDPPAELGLGQFFVLRMESDAAQPQDVDSAVIYVEGASKYITVTSGLVAVNGGWEMRLSGILLADTELKNKNFDLKVALKTSTGLTGAYKPWSLKILDISAVGGGSDVVKGTSVPGGELNESGRPPGDGSPDIPQIQGIDAPESVVPEEQVDVVLYSNNIQSPADVQAIIVSAPTSDSYWRVTNFDVITPVAKDIGDSYGFRMSVTVPALDLDVSSIVLLWALEKSGRQVGLYFPWEFTLAEPADGDMDEEETETADEEPDEVIDGDDTDPEESEPEAESDEEEPLPDPSTWGFETVYVEDNPNMYINMRAISGAVGAPLSPCVIGDGGEQPFGICQGQNEWSTLPPISQQETNWLYAVDVSVDQAVFMSDSSSGDIHTFDPESQWTTHAPQEYPFADYRVMDVARGPSGSYYVLSVDDGSDTGPVYHLYNVSGDLASAVEIPFEVQSPTQDTYSPRSMVSVWNADETADLLYILCETSLLKYDGAALTEEWTGDAFTPGWKSTIHGTAHDDLWTLGTVIGSGAVALYHFDGESWIEIPTGVAAGEMGPGAVWSLGDEGLFFVVDTGVFYLNPEYSDAPIKIGFDPQGYGELNALWGASLREMYLVTSKRIEKLTFNWTAPACEPNVDMSFCDGNTIVECSYDTWDWVRTDCDPGFICLDDSAYPQCIPEMTDGDLDMDTEEITTACTDNDLPYCEGDMLYQCVGGEWQTTDCYSRGQLCVPLAEGPLCGQCNPETFTPHCQGNLAVHCDVAMIYETDCSIESATCVETGAEAYCEPGSVDIPQSTQYSFTSVYSTSTGESVSTLAIDPMGEAGTCITWTAMFGSQVLCDDGGGFLMKGSLDSQFWPRTLGFDSTAILVGGAGSALGSQAQNDLFRFSGTAWDPMTMTGYLSDDNSVDFISTPRAGDTFVVYHSNATSIMSLVHRDANGNLTPYTLPGSVTSIFDIATTWPDAEPLIYLVTNDGIFYSNAGTFVKVVDTTQVGFQPGCSIAMNPENGWVWASAYDTVMGHPMIMIYDGGGWTNYPLEMLTATSGTVGDVLPIGPTEAFMIFDDKVLHYVLMGPVEEVPWEQFEVGDKPVQLEGYALPNIYLRTERTLQKLDTGTGGCYEGEQYCDGTMLYECMYGDWAPTDCAGIGPDFQCTTCLGGYQCAAPCTQSDLSYCDGDVLYECVMCDTEGFWKATDCYANAMYCSTSPEPMCI